MITQPMTIKRGSLVLGSGTNYVINPGITGLGKAPIRTTQDDYSGTNGGYVSSSNFSRRPISIPITAFADSCDDLDVLSRNLQENTTIGTLEQTLFTMPNGKQYAIDTVVTDLTDSYESTNQRPYKLELVAPYPFFYDPTSGTGLNSVNVYKALQRGFFTPFVTPFILAASGLPTNVINNGSIDTYPIVTFAGKFTNPRITNITTGQYLQVNVSTNTGDILKIDMQKREITLNGGSVAGYRAVGSSWVRLARGNNTMIISSGDGTDGIFANVSWYNYLAGI